MGLGILFKGPRAGLHQVHHATSGEPSASSATPNVENLGLQESGLVWVYVGFELGLGFKPPGLTMLPALTLGHAWARFLVRRTHIGRSNINSY